MYDKALDELDIKLRLGKMNINILYLRLDPFRKGARILNHSHSGYELHIIPEGRGTLRIDGSEFEIHPGTLYLTGPGVFHEQICDDEDPMKEYCLNFEVSTINRGHSVDMTDEDISLISEAICKTGFWFGPDRHGCAQIFKKILDEADNKYPGYFMSIKNYIIQLLISTARCYLDGAISVGEPPKKSADERRRLIFDQYLQNYALSLTVSELAQSAGLSIRQTERVFKRYYGMSFTKKISAIRIKMAAGMLSDESLTVTEAAARCGFEDVSYFCRVFRKTMGMTAGEYLKFAGKKK